MLFIYFNLSDGGGALLFRAGAHLPSKSSHDLSQYQSGHLAFEIKMHADQDLPHTQPQTQSGAEPDWKVCKVHRRYKGLATILHR